MEREVCRCRICGNSQLEPVLNLGVQYLTGVFPTTRNAKISSGPLELVKCVESEGSDACGLLQLRHSFEPEEMYGEGYGYRSGINQTMTEHLGAIVENALTRVELQAGDIVLDIGSNDATLLKNYTQSDISLLGVDPSAAKFKEFYPDHVQLVVDYFNADMFRNIFDKRKARIITSIAMFYDLETPLKFVQDVYDILDDDGIWILEQSYLLAMIDENTYDTICHEHLEYYGFRQIKWMTDRIGLKIIDVELNKINGGSFCVTVARKSSSKHKESAKVAEIISEEYKRGLHTIALYHEFRDKIVRHKEDLLALLREIQAEGKTVYGYGASTKGNVILQFCGLTSRDLKAIADRNPAKHGAFTPGTGIEIISEEEARKQKPDYFLALPWHFRDEFLRRETEFISQGGKFLFPLPEISVVGVDR